MKYSEKLKDVRWQKLRLEILQRDEWACQRCGDEKSTLHVHHKQYHGDPWDAPAESLETLCESCHETRKHHNQKYMNLPSWKAASVIDIGSMPDDVFNDIHSIFCDIAGSAELSNLVAKFATKLRSNHFKANR
jgi:phage terminase large subunit GpA-like protein